MEDLLELIDAHIDTLNELVFIDECDDEDLARELSALVYSKKFFTCKEWELEHKPFYAKMFFKYFDEMDFQNDFITRVSRKMESTISSLI